MTGLLFQRLATSWRDRGLVVLLLAVAIPVLAVAYRDVGFASIVIFLLAGVSARVWRTREDWVLGVTGATIGPLAELAATSSGLWTYAVVSVGPLPLWTFAMWWIYPIAVTRLVDSAAGQPSSPPLALSHSALLAAGTVAWLCSFGARQPLIALAGTALLVALIIAQCGSKETVGRLIVCGLIGPAAEAWPISAGAWTYPSSAWFGMPVWLMTGYAVFGWALIELGRGVNRERVLDPMWANQQRRSSRVS